MFRYRNNRLKHSLKTTRQKINLLIRNYKKQKNPEKTTPYNLRKSIVKIK